MRPHDVEYVLPLKWGTHDRHDPALGELARYLAGLARRADVTVVDGSPAPAFMLHAAALPATVRHLPPDPWPGCNGKVAGVVTGVRVARHECVVIADDDVRYGEASLRAVVAAMRGLLGEEPADLVRPQNVFAPLPWHARWDTGRMLLNRALGRDHPGTFGVRRSSFLAMGGYDGDAMFENLELARTVRAAGGVERHLPGVYVRRLPPATSHFWSQRVRQAYDDLAQPLRLTGELALLPFLAGTALTGRLRWLIGLAAAVVTVAEVGRRRAGGRAVFPADTSLWAVPWLVERSVCVWIALGHRLRGGVPYRGTRIRRSAHRVSELRARPRPVLPVRDLRPVDLPARRGSLSV